MHGCERLDWFVLVASTQLKLTLVHVVQPLSSVGEGEGTPACADS
jgi:hypothetical protein